MSTRKKSTRRPWLNAELIDPRYLQSGALMMAMNNMSSSQAVMAMYINDTEVYGQEQSLPLSMQKKYQSELSLAKKLKRRVDEAIGVTADIFI